MLKKLLILFVLFILVLTVAAFGMFYWWSQSVTAPSRDASKATITITKGSSADAIGKKLAASGVIRNELAYKIYLKINDLSDKIPVGQFEIAKNLSLSDVIAVLLKGPTEVWVTVPEGLRREQVPYRFLTVLNYPTDKADSFTNHFLELIEVLEVNFNLITYLLSKDIT